MRLVELANEREAIARVLGGLLRDRDRPLSDDASKASRAAIRGSVSEPAYSEMRGPAPWR
jgi:hypothetical protein